MIGGLTSRVLAVPVSQKKKRATLHKNPLRYLNALLMQVATRAILYSIHSVVAPPLAWRPRKLGRRWIGIDSFQRCH